MSLPEFQYYPAKVKSSRPIGLLSLDELAEGVKNPSPQIKEVFKKIAQAEKDEDWDLKASLKQENLFYFTPCVFLSWEGVTKKRDDAREYKSYRTYDNISYFTGLAVLDFDHIDHAEEFRDYIFNKYSFIYMAFVSSSKKGVKFIVNIPKAESVKDFKSYFYGLGYTFDKYKGFDGTPQNSVLPLFLSYDQNLLFRKNPTLFNKKGSKLNAFKVGAGDVKPADFEVTNDDVKRVYKNIEKAFNAIVSNGHPQVIAACVSLGGYVSSGYLPQDEAERLAFSLIESNTYLQKGVSGYKKTAKTAIIEGMKSNLILKNS